MFPKDHRPLDWIESLAFGDCLHVKRICLKRGGALSLRSHNCKSEHWNVVGGAAKVTIDEEDKRVIEVQSVYILLDTIHRMEKPRKARMVLIEQQIGTCLGEHDIIRYQDVYARN